jgi:hypothetical protein
MGLVGVALLVSSLLGRRYMILVGGSNFLGLMDKVIKWSTPSSIRNGHNRIRGSFVLLGL